MAWLGNVIGDTANAVFSGAAQMTTGAAGMFYNMSEAEVYNNTNKAVMVMWWGYQDITYTGYDGFEILQPGHSLTTSYGKPDPSGVQVGVVHTIEHQDIIDYIECILAMSSQTLNLGQAKLHFYITCCKNGNPIKIESVKGNADDPNKGRVTFSGDHWWLGTYEPHWHAYQNNSLVNYFAGKVIDLGQLGLDMCSLGATAGAKAVAKELARQLAKQVVKEFTNNLKNKIKAMAKAEGLRMVEEMLQTNLSALQLPPRTIKGIAKLLLGNNREAIEAN